MQMCLLWPEQHLEIGFPAFLLKNQIWQCWVLVVMWQHSGQLMPPVIYRCLPVYMGHSRHLGVSNLVKGFG